MQLVGGTYADDGSNTVTNHRSDRPAAYFAERYRDDGLVGGHVIKLGPENDAAARKALAAWPGGLQVGGGINATNAAMWPWQLMADQAAEAQKAPAKKAAPKKPAAARAKTAAAAPAKRAPATAAGKPATTRTKKTP